VWTREEYDHKGYPKQYSNCSKKGRRHNNDHSAEVVQDADQYSNVDQESDELIFIKDSYNCYVESTDTQAAVSLQVGLQLAIALVLRITILDSDEDGAISEELLQSFTTVQSNKQKIIIENSKDVNVKTVDTDLSVNIQALLQVLLSLVATLDVL
jgi:spore coat protein X